LSGEGNKKIMTIESKNTLLNLLGDHFPEDIKKSFIYGWNKYFWDNKLKKSYQLIAIVDIMSKRISSAERICILSPNQISVL
jgi:hypothetical protein